MYIQHRKKTAAKRFTYRLHNREVSAAKNPHRAGVDDANGALEAPIKMRQVQVMRQKKGALKRETKKKCLTAAGTLVVLEDGNNPVNKSK